MEDSALCDIERERSCDLLKGCPGGANVGVLAVVKASVVVDELGRVVKEARISSFPSQRCNVGLNTMPFSSARRSETCCTKGARNSLKALGCVICRISCGFCPDPFFL